MAAIKHFWKTLNGCHEASMDVQWRCMDIIRNYEKCPDYRRHHFCLWAAKLTKEKLDGNAKKIGSLRNDDGNGNDNATNQYDLLNAEK